MASLFNQDLKKPSPKEIPDDLTDFLIVRETGWTLEYIRNMSISDYSKYAIMCRMTQEMDSAREIAMLNKNIL